MIYRKFKNLDEKLSLLGFGSMRLPLDADGEIDVEHVKKMVAYGIENGVTYFDHAWFYHNYKSESLMGEILSEYDRSSIYMADKMPLWECESEEDVENLFKKQLENLKTDYIDFYLLHAVNPKVIEKFHKFNVAEKLTRWKAEGKINHVGFSFHSDLETFKIAIDLYDWEFSLLQLNYMDVDHQQGITGYNMLKEREIPVFIMEPVKGGNLAGFNDEINKIFLDYNPDASIASWAIRWLAALDNVAVIVSGMSNFEQIVDNIKTIKAYDGVTDEEMLLIDQVYKEVKARNKVNCTGCNYCMPCPLGVNIPKAFSVLNDYSMYENEKFLDWAYSLLHRDKQLPSQCVDCGKCVPLCPQNLDIPNLLKEVSKIDPQN